MRRALILALFLLVPGLTALARSQIDTSIPTTVFTNSVTVTGAQLATLFSSPITALPAQGAGKIAWPIAVILKFSSPMPKITGGSSVPVAIYENGSPGSPAFYISVLPQPLLSGSALLFGYSDASSPLAFLNTENKKVLLTSQSDIGVWGPIASSVLNAGGAGYAVGDTGIISQEVGGASGSSDATYIVNTVDGGGAVLTYTLTNPGTIYQTKVGASTATGGAQPGGGDGNFAVDLTVTTNAMGSGSVLVLYTVK